MNAGEESSKDLPLKETQHEVIEYEVIFSKRLIYGFILTMLVIFIFFLFLHSTLNLDDSLPPGWVTIPIEFP
jgi:hypothetical protein